MLKLEGELVEVDLLPGEMFLAREPAMIRTILGSCVSATFWSRRLGVGALCHCQLPKCPKSADGRFNGVARASGHRYVDFTIHDLARQFDELGAVRSEVQIKLFGGADVLVVSNPMKATVGRLNCEAAIDAVAAEGLRVTASSLGGTSGLNIKFNTRTGEVLLRRLSRVLFEDIPDE